MSRDRHARRARALLAAAWAAALLAVPGGDAAVADHRTELERADLQRLTVLVTKEQPLRPPEYEPPDLVGWRDEPYQVRAEVSTQLERLFTAAERDGAPLRVVSGYRSFQTQAEVFDYWRRRHGEEVAERRSARPGHSEHQTGLAVDVDGSSGGCYLRQCFGDTEAGRWVARHAHRFGFVLSYPPDTLERTGYAYEPWHLRYVGPRLAGAMREQDIALLEDALRGPFGSALWGALLGRGH
ncbi:M15 family metallopeptidase [Ornithinicoccus halotolerans]|uniref:M15 family metallopeptidase n=1 Tax=Ornithinicoccus halotolerans TaxID=1748220 RepID=UPI001297A501|nr:M15 family metallopeptidase [Ornithinicoccus halotolerans]